MLRKPDGGKCKYKFTLPYRMDSSINLICNLHKTESAGACFHIPADLICLLHSCVQGRAAGGLFQTLGHGQILAEGLPESLLQPDIPAQTVTGANQRRSRTAGSQIRRYITFSS